MCQILARSHNHPHPGIMWRSFKGCTISQQQQTSISISTSAEHGLVIHRLGVEIMATEAQSSRLEIFTRPPCGQLVTIFRQAGSSSRRTSQVCKRAVMHSCDSTVVEVSKTSPTLLRCRSECCSSKAVDLQGSGGPWFYQFCDLASHWELGELFITHCQRTS